MFSVQARHQIPYTSRGHTSTLGIYSQTIVAILCHNLKTKVQKRDANLLSSWPVVIVAHGMDQSRSRFEPLAKAIASEGAVVYNIDVAFSFPSPARPSPNQTPTCHKRPSLLQQAFLPLAWGFQPQATLCVFRRFEHDNR